jgi:hypothetical protein
MLLLNRLRAIIENLNEYELNYIHKNILLIRTKPNLNKSNFDSKVFFELLIKNRNKNNEDYITGYLNKFSEASVKKGMQRITDRIMELLVSKEVLLNNDFYDNRSKEVFLIRRKLLYYDILASHGVTKYALNLLDQVINSSKRIEYYEYLLIALDKKLIKMSLQTGEKNFNFVYKNILYYSDCLSSFRKSIYLLRQYNSNFQFKQKVFSLARLKSSIQMIEKDYIRTKSKNIGVVLFYMQGIYHFNQGAHLICKKKFLDLYSFLRRNKYIFYDSSFDSCILNIAECDTLLFNFDKSTYWLSKISAKYVMNEFNANLLNEMKFLNCFYSGDIVRSQFYLNKLLIRRKLSNISKFVTARQIYYLSVYFYLIKDFNNVNRELKKCHDLDSDKDGWNIGVRILSIINFIELEKYSLAESLIENLRKHLERVEGNSFFLNRSKLISKIFNSLVLNSFDFKLTFSNIKPIINILSDSIVKYKWIIKSPEMIPFHEWFDSKVKNVPYNHVEAMKRLKKLNSSKS